MHIRVEAWSEAGTRPWWVAGLLGAEGRGRGCSGACAVPTNHSQHVRLEIDFWRVLVQERTRRYVLRVPSVRSGTKCWQWWHWPSLPHPSSEWPGDLVTSRMLATVAQLPDTLTGHETRRTPVLTDPYHEAPGSAGVPMLLSAEPCWSPRLFTL